MKMAKIKKKNQKPSFAEAAEQLKLVFTAGGNAKLNSHFRSLAVSYELKYTIPLLSLYASTFTQADIPCSHETCTQMFLGLYL